MKKNLHLVISLLLAANTSCIAATWDSNKQTTVEMVESTYHPDLDTTGTIAGIDSSRNGVRDDIDAYINDLFLTSPQRKQLLAYAAKIQAALLVNHSDIKSVKQVEEQRFIAMTCYEVAQDNPSKAQQRIKRIEHYTVNTYQRAKAFRAYNKALDGTSIRKPRRENCH